MNEHRFGDRLIGYWNILRKDLPMPNFNHLNTSSIADIWQNCILFTVTQAVENKPHTLNFYQMGDKIRGMYGSNMLGHSFNTTQRHFQGATIIKRVEEIINNPTALTDVGQFVNERSKVVKYRSCLLPFGRDGKVTHILVGISWREF